MCRCFRVIREAALLIGVPLRLVARKPHRIFIALLATALLVAGVIEGAIRSARLPVGLSQSPPSTPVVTAIRGETIAVLPTSLARESYPATLKEMGEWLPVVTVGIEDARYWQHRGLDFFAMTGATLRNLRYRRVISGASTITQQLIKLCSEGSKRSLLKKIKGALSALKLERNWDKRRILEAYLNRLDYGNRRIGPEAGARAYFGISARDLSLSEAIFLAGLPQSPSRLNPWRNPDAAIARYRRNVRLLASAGFLPTDASLESLLANPPRVIKHAPPNEAPHFIELLQQRRHRNPRRLSNREDGIIATSLDLELQRLAVRALRHHLAATASLGVGDAAIVIIENSTGAVRALASVGHPKHAALNAATEPRNCGSTLKPFLYLAAIEQRRLTGASLLPDTPDAISAEYRDYDPQNYSKRYLGPVRVREALASSLNVPAVFALAQIGARETFGYLRAWGFDFPGPFDAYGASFILGNAPVRLLDLAGAYAGLARGGDAWIPKLTPIDPVESRRLASREACTIIADILCDNQARRAGFGAFSPLNLPERTAVKTGTSSGFRDGWCVGFNKDHTVAVWTGNLDGRVLGEVLSVRSAAPLWAEVMKSLYKAGDRPWPAMEESALLRAVDIAAETGLLPRPKEPVVREWFLRGTEPVEHASRMYINGVLQLPAEYLAWCSGPQNRLGATVRSMPLKILFPKDGATFCYNPALPKSQQMLPLQSSWEGCEWFLNGRRLEQALIPLERGRWTISVRAGRETASSSYVVE
jgi:penicillin-binding protein 1C